jgi:hypothetical protein
MRNTIILLIILVTTNYQAMSQNNGTPKVLTAEEGQSLVTTRGDLSEGIFMEDLSWAWNSSVACFPETQEEKVYRKACIVSNRPAILYQHEDHRHPG